MRTLRMWALLVLCVACTSESASRGADERAVVADKQAAEPGLSQRVADVAPASPPSSTPAPGSAQATDSAAPSMLIRTGRAVLEVDSLELAIARVRELATRVGGYVSGSTVEGGADRLRAATLELKIPAPRWGEVIRGLDPVGRIESVSEETQDVGEEYVDLSARLTNSRRLESRLIELLDRQTGKLEDVLAVERELARVREEIERYEGRLRYLRTRVATSTLVVYVHEPTPLVGAPGENVIADSFRNAWRNFVSFIAGLISASGVLIPVALLAIVGFLVFRRYGDRWRRPREK